MSEYDLKALSEAVIKADINTAVSETGKALEAGCEVQSILNDGLISSMDVVGERFSKGALFVPQMLRSAKAMQECMLLIKPHLQEGDESLKGEVVIGTVKGDLHDIGKNLVAMMLEGAGFAITDLGVDVSPEAFIAAAKEKKASIIAMSALLSTTMPAMRETIAAFDEAGLRKEVKILIGGAPVTDSFAREVGADCYAPDAGSVVGEAKKLLGVS